MLTYTLFGRSKRQFHRIDSGSHCPVAIVVGLLQNTVQKPEVLLGVLLLARDTWSGTVGSSGICPAWTPLECLPGHLGYRKTRRGLHVRNTILFANAEYACSLLCEGSSE